MGDLNGSFVLVSRSEGSVSLLAIHVRACQGRGDRVTDKLTLYEPTAGYCDDDRTLIVGFLNLQSPSLVFVADETTWQWFAELITDIRPWSCFWLNEAHLPATKTKPNLSNERRNDEILQLMFLSDMHYLINSCTQFKFPIPRLQSLPSNRAVTGNQRVLLFVDLEHTAGKNPRHITELCMYAVAESALVAQTSENILRHCDKLVLMVDPQKEIAWKAKELTRLSNYQIRRSKKRPISQQAPVMEAFIRRQGQNVCLLAHNGKSCDFRILREDLRAAEQPEGSAWRSLTCADTLAAFRRLLGRRESTGEKISFALGNLYQRYARQPMENSHRAEEDVVALIKVLKLESRVLDYLEVKRFVEVPNEIPENEKFQRLESN